MKDWAQAIAKRSGMGKARVALARKLSVSGEPLGSTILHSIWRSGAVPLVGAGNGRLTEP